MPVTREHYGTTKDGAPVDLFTLTNACGLTVRCIDYGCRIAGILLPTPGGATDIALGYDSLADYEADTSCQGALVGRYANRIRGAAFELGGKKFHLTQNDDKNHLHGSFHRRVFAAEATEEGVLFEYVSPAGEDGFPGELRVRAAYTLDDANRLKLEYTATTDAETVINLSNHTYFDLSGGEAADIGGHQLQLLASRYLEIAEDLCPTGKILSARGTALDFTTPKPIGQDIGCDEEQLLRAGGYDHCFILDGENTRDGMRLAAVTADAGGRRLMRVFSTQPALQFYSGNFLDGTTGGKGRKFTRRSGFCLETQHYPDSPNQPSFPATTLKPGETYRETTMLAFDF